MSNSEFKIESYLAKKAKLRKIVRESLSSSKSNSRPLTGIGGELSYNRRKAISEIGGQDRPTLRWGKPSRGAKKAPVVYKTSAGFKLRDKIKDSEKGGEFRAFVIKKDADFAKNPTGKTGELVSTDALESGDDKKIHNEYIGAAWVKYGDAWLVADLGQEEFNKQAAALKALNAPVRGDSSVSPGISVAAPVQSDPRGLSPAYYAKELERQKSMQAIMRDPGRWEIFIMEMGTGEEFRKALKELMEIYNSDNVGENVKSLISRSFNTKKLDRYSKGGGGGVGLNISDIFMPVEVDWIKRMWMQSIGQQSGLSLREKVNLEVHLKIKNWWPDGKSINIDSPLWMNFGRDRKRRNEVKELLFENAQRTFNRINEVLKDIIAEVKDLKKGDEVQGTGGAKPQPPTPQSSVKKKAPTAEKLESAVERFRDFKIVVTRRPM